MNKFKKIAIFFMVILLFASGILLYADDTGIYQSSVKQNAMILVDTSGSMAWPVYEWTEDYGDFYDFLIDEGDAHDYDSNNAYYNNHYESDRIYLIAGSVGWVQTDSNGCGQTGDNGSPSINWYNSTIYASNMKINGSGDLEAVSGGSFTISKNSSNHILLNNSLFSHCQDIVEHNIHTNADGSQIDQGFAGMMRAPGLYFTGYFLKRSCSGMCLTSNSGLAATSSGRRIVYYLVTGNWLNMLHFLDMEVYTNSPTYCDNGRRYRDAWRYCWHGASANWSQASITPQRTHNYYYNNRNTWFNTIHQPGALQMKLHFNYFDVYSGWRYSCKHDYLEIYYSYGGSNWSKITLDRNSSHDGDYDFWVGPLNADTVRLHFVSDSCRTDNGFKVDRYRYSTGSGGTPSNYRVQSRLDVAKKGIIAVMQATSNKVNWGAYRFNSCDGGSNVVNLNSSLNGAIQAINNLSAGGGTPLGEASQDVWNYFKGHNNYLSWCQNNFLITLTDGNPTCDSDWSRVSGITFHDWDGDNWTEDPNSYSSPPEDYWDDVAHYMATHDMAPSLEGMQNVTNFVIGLNLDAPLAKDVAEDAGGMYTVAYNEQQVISAFYSFGLVISKMTTYTAPVVSVDTENKTQSGDEMVLAYFKPEGGRPWVGNVKAYHIGDDGEFYGSDGQIVTDTDGYFKDSSKSCWTSEEDGNEIEKGGVGSKLLNAQINADMSNDPYGYRNIYYWSGSWTPFIPSNVTNSDLTVSDDATRYNIINFMYGYAPSHVGSGTHPEYPVSKRSWVLGDIVHSTASIINYDSTGYIVVGSNDGMLHVFRNSDCSDVSDSAVEEVAAFVFPDDIVKIKSFVLTPSDHNYFVDGTVKYYETFDGKKRLIIGKRRGGNVYYLLNIESSDPANWSIITNITNSNMGFSFSEPSIFDGRFDKSMSSMRTLIFVGGGYDAGYDGPANASSPQGRGIYIYDGTTGSLLGSYTNSDNSQLLYSFPTKLGVYDLDGNLTPETIYAGDIKGRVWRFNVQYTTTGAVAGITGKIIFKATHDSDQRMFYKPQVSLGECWLDEETPVLFFGTGDRANLTRTDVNNRVYAVMDDDPSTPYDDGDLVDVSDNDGSTTLDSTDKGWYMDLDATGEKMVSPMLLFNKKLYFQSYVPTNSDPCRPSGLSYSYVVDYCKGKVESKEEGEAPGSGYTIIVRNGVVSIVHNQSDGHGSKTVKEDPGVTNTIYPLFFRIVP